MAELLVVDDDPVVVEAISAILVKAGHRVTAVGDVAAAEQRLADRLFDLLIAGSAAVAAVVAAAEKGQRHAAVLALVAGGAPPPPGAWDAIDTPLRPADVSCRIERALALVELRRENERLREDLRRKGPAGQVVGTSPPMQELLRGMESAARVDSPVLICGERGTEKESVARYVHFSGPRRSGPFLYIPCGLLPEEALARELFGHVGCLGRTADALDRRGAFETAAGGTVFLDDVDRSSPAVQLKLRRVVRDRQVQPVGDVRIRAADVRVIAATEQPPLRNAAGCSCGAWLLGLPAICLHLPPLRDRPDDICYLTAGFLAGLCPQLGGTPLQLDDDAAAALRAYSWPGNVWELENALARAAALCREGVIRRRDLPQQVAGAAVPAPPRDGSGSSGAPAAGGRPALRTFLQEQEQRYIGEVLASVGGDKTRAAALLGVSLATFYRKVDPSQKGPRGRRGAAP